MLTLIGLGFYEWRRTKIQHWLIQYGVVSGSDNQKEYRAVNKQFSDAVRKLKQHLPYLIVLFLIVLAISLPVFQFKLMSGHDTREYLPRQIEFYEGLRHGILFPRWAANLSAGYGQPFFNFNPPAFYYIAAFWKLFGCSFVGSQNLAIFTIILFSALGMCLLGVAIFGKKAGLVIAAAYICAPYFLVVLYVRHALADFTAFAWLPFAFLGLYRFAREGKTRYLAVGVIAIGLLTISSNPIALITVPFIILFLTWNAWTQKSWRVFLRGLTCLGIGIGLGAFFWLPALGEMQFVHLERLREGYLSYSNHFVFPVQLIHSPWGYGLSLPGMPDGMSFEIGPMHLLLALFSLMLLAAISKLDKAAAFWVKFALVGLGLALFFTSSLSAFVWKYLQLLQVIEFPWRILTMAVFASALLFGAPFVFRGFFGEKRVNWGGAVLLSLLLIYALPKAEPEQYFDVSDAEYTPEAISQFNLSVTTAREYETVWMQTSPQAPAEALFTIRDGEAQILSARITPNELFAQVNVQTPIKLQANLAYFPGWKLFVDGEETPSSILSPYCLIGCELSLYARQ